MKNVLRLKLKDQVIDLLFMQKVYRLEAAFDVLVMINRELRMKKIEPEDGNAFLTTAQVLQEIARDKPRETGDEDFFHDISTDQSIMKFVHFFAPSIICMQSYEFFLSIFSITPSLFIIFQQ